MPVLLIAEKYPPVVGGGETHLEQLAIGLAAAKHEVTVATDGKGLRPSVDCRDGVRIVDLPGLADACSGLNCYRAVESVHRVLTTEAADVVHVINYVPALIVSWLRASVPVPLVFSSFETFIPSKRVFGLFDNFPLEMTLQRSLVQALRADLFVCGSAAYQRWAMEAGFDERIILTIPHSTDPARFAFAPRIREEFRAARRWSRDEFVFLVPARPVPRKRIEDVLTAAAAVLPKYPIRVVLTAPTGRLDTNYLQKLETLVRDHDLGRCVTWESGLSWREMPALYSACDAVILPSSNEGFAISLLEAMAASRPVIATAIEGPDEYLRHGTNGYVYPPADIDALTRTMIHVMTSDSTDIVKCALDLVRTEFSVTKMVERYSEAYSRLVQSSGGNSRSICEKQ
jgi:glycosyltransferase involved in cell wall biosynthesis